MKASGPVQRVEWPREVHDQSLFMLGMWGGEYMEKTNELRLIEEDLIPQSGLHKANAFE